MRNLFLLFILFSFLALQGRGQTTPESVWVDSTLQRMSLDEKIGQLFMIAVYSNQTENYETEIEKQLLKYHIGGIIFFQGEPSRQIKLTNRYQKASKYPLLIGLDAEHGVGWRLKNAMEFPKMGILGAVSNDSLIYRLGATIARHCHELGVHVNFAPVVDINSNPLNPVIGIRAFCEDPEEVAQKGILYMTGSLSQGVLPVVKHFPGHGDTDTDSHKALPSILHSRQRLDSIELYPYRALIEAGVPAVMTSHLNVPSLDSTGVPASLSPTIIDGLLKDQLGFKGLCFTDAMNMKGVTQNAPSGEAEVKALLAGNDVLLFPEHIGKAVQAVRQAITDSLISEEMLNEKCRKILAAKWKFALPNTAPSETEGLWSRLHRPEALALKQHLYKEAITLIRNNDSLLPLKRLDTLKIASLHFGGGKLNNFQTTLNHYTSVSHFTVPANLSADDLRNWKQKLKSYNCIILYNSTANNSFSKNFGYNRTLEALVAALKGKRLILCHPAIPYGLSHYMTLPLDAVLISYENHLYAQQYAAQAIFGGIACKGRLPVSIDSTYRAGLSLHTAKTRLSYETPEAYGLHSDRLDRIDSLCKRAIQLKATPGCQVLVAKDGAVIYNKAFGYHTYQQKKANKTTDIYDIASVTKITATLPAVMKLYDEGKIELDNALASYYPPLDTTDKKDITVHEVLCHNAGLKTFIPFFPNAIDKKSIPGPLFTTRRTATNTLRLKDRLYANVDYRFRDSTISRTPREGYKFIAPGLYLYPAYQDTIRQAILTSPLNARKTYAYSDLGFILLKYAVEYVSGETLSRFCKNNFYLRLGMNSTDFRAAERLPKSRIVPSCYDKLYRKTEINGFVHDPTAALLGGIAGHAGLFSTAGDLAKILQMYLNKGSYGGERFLSPETLSLFSCRNTTYDNNRRALGFDKPEPDSSKTSPVCNSTPLSSFGHTGFTGIMAWCDPDNNLIYIFMSNRTYPDEFNTKLSKENIRTKIQEVIYEALGREVESL